MHHIYKYLQIFKNLTYLKSGACSEPSQRFKIEFFAKVVKSCNYFSKGLHRRSLTGFWICLSLNKHSLTCRVTSHYLRHDTYSEPCLLLEIQTYSVISTSYSYIFSNILAYLESCAALAYSEPCYIHNPGIVRTQAIFRTLSRHILSYSECCIVPAYWEAWYIQNFAIFRILAYLGPKAYSDIFSNDNNINFLFLLKSYIPLDKI